MNTLQALSALTQNLKVPNQPDGTMPPAEVTMEILRALNAGLSTFYRLAPAAWRTTTLSTTLRAPAAVNLEFSAKYSRMLVGDPFDAEQLGCTVRVDNYTPDNEVSGTDSVLDDYLGDDLTVSAQVFGDTAPLSVSISRMVSDPRIYGPSLSSGGGRLTRVTWHECKHHNQISPPGLPTRYGFEPAAVSLGGGFWTFLRVSPAPDLDYLLRFEAELAAARLTFADMVNPKEIPVPDHATDDIFLPLCERHLLRSPFWADDRRRGAVADAAALAERSLRLISPDPGLTNHSVGTPTNF